MLSRFVAFTSLGRKALPNQYDLFAFALILAAFIAIAHASHGLTLPLTAPESTVVSLDYKFLPYYALRTTLRMFAAIVASLVFTFVYATLAAKSRRAALVLIPLLDVLQSVPILGFLSFTVTFFLGLFPGSILGAECARSSRFSPRRPGTWPFPFTSRFAPSRATWSKSRVVLGSLGGSVSGSLRRHSRCPDSFGT